MKTMHTKLIAAAAAVLMTSASLATTALLSMAPQVASAEKTPVTIFNGLKVTNLPAVDVQPSASDRVEASLLVDIGTIGLATLPTLGRSEQENASVPLGLIGSQLVMPYYSFGKAFDRISKE